MPVNRDSARSSFRRLWPCALALGLAAPADAQHSVALVADKTTISGTDGLLKYLQSKDTLVMKTLSKKMLGYALGRTVLASDQPLLNEMMAAGNGATFSDLAIKIVTSRQFRSREGQGEAVAAPKTPVAATVAALDRPSTSRAGTR